MASRPQPIPPEHVDKARDVFLGFARRFQLNLERLWQPEAELCIDYAGDPVDWFDKAAWLRAKLDLTELDGTLALIEDWKTSWVVPTEDEWKQDIQARTYAFLLWRWNQVLREIHVTANYVRFGVRRTAVFRRDDFERTWQEWRAHSDSVERALDHLGKDKFWKPTPGPHCATCPVSTLCPLGQDKLTDLTIADEATAIAVAERVTVLDAVGKALKDRLKPWVEAHGPLTVGGLVFGFHPHSAWDYPAEQVRQLAEQYGVPQDQLLKIDSTAIKRLTRGYPKFAAAVAAVAKPTGGTQFGFKKAEKKNG